jgi:hypothetical protein
MVIGKVKRILRLGNCERAPVEWLSPERIPAGKLIVIDGDPDRGKSLVTLDVAARLTTGRAVFDGPAFREPISVVLVGSEDGIRDTVLPRLSAAGADVNRVIAFVGKTEDGIGDSPPLFPDDCDLLRETLQESGARLVIVDPLMAFVRAGGGSGPQIRRALEPLARLADQTGAAIILVRHLSKGGRGQQAIYRGIGSIAIIGTARMAYLVGPHPKDSELRVLACSKNNLATFPPSLSFRVTANAAGDPVVTWADAVDVPADDLVLAPARPDGEALRQARGFLENILREAPCRADEALRRALAAGFSLRTIERAKADMPIESRLTITRDKRHWVWHLRDFSEPDDSLSWSEKEEKRLEQAQKESDDLLAHLRARYGEKPIVSRQ